MNPIREAKEELVKYLGLQIYPLSMKKRPFFLVNNSMGSTIKYDPLKHKVSVADLHKMSADTKKYNGKFHINIMQ